MESKLERLENILNYEVNMRKRKRDGIVVRQPKLFKAIPEVINELDEEDVIDHILLVCEDIFLFEAKRYLTEIKKMREENKIYNVSISLKPTGFSVTEV